MKTSIWTRIVDLVAPRRCVMCDGRLDVEEEYLCLSCSNQLPRTLFHRKPYDNPMAQLFWGLMPVERVTAWFYYAPHTRTSQILYDLKYHHQSDIGMVLGEAFASEIKDSGFFEGIDTIIPVPLAKEREQQRGYNQSLMIARGVSQATGISVMTDVLRRLHFSESQTQLDRWERLKNVEQQFQALHPEVLQGKHVLFIDDVVTTGATLIACAQALQPKVHNIRFSVLSLGFTKT